ncbi:MAG: GGDEF domain-containing protein [Frankiaceae bacterium]|nr:GGDEF domain-containing protein [Frankiaceae bacterium]MBV9872093.1 GGDEF domain-containing protein [Frankiaceae bacterium]
MTDAFRIVIASALAMIAVLASAVAWFFVAGNPTTDRTTRVVNVSQDVATLLIEEQSILRAYVVTGNRAMLASYGSVHDQIESDLASLASDGMGTSIQPQVERMQSSVLKWEESWAKVAMDPATRESVLARDGNLKPDALLAFVLKGRANFAAIDRVTNDLKAAGLRAEAHARHTMLAVVSATALLLLVIAGGAARATMSRRHTLYTRVVGPIGVLLSKVQAVGKGEFGPSPTLDAPEELLELRDELADMSASLKLQQQVLASRADAAAASARRLKLVVEFAREISDSLTLGNVLAAVTSSSRRLVESPRARVWLLAEDHNTLQLQHDSITGEVVAPLTHAVGVAGIGRAARDHRVYYSAGLTGEPVESGPVPLVVAVPLVKGTRLIGVLEIVLKTGADRLDAATVDVLTATAGHAATAIDAALLYALSESLSRSDPLTGLANRRQLDADLELEVERSARYHRPLTFLMLDIDHFKAVNDSFGHALGDAVLREVADVLRHHMRAGDTAYRYGGEEFAVLTRETDEAGGAAVAERLRRAIQDHYAAADAGDIAVTISVGLASISADTESAEVLVAAADAALYEAKRAGRNCVRIGNLADLAPVIPAQACAAG